MVFSIYSIIKIISQYNVEYTEIPSNMVDTVETINGNRYVNYKGVNSFYKDGDKTAEKAGDTNGYDGDQWNALYFTKSYEAGKPLLAKFKVSNNNNKADDKYLPIHRFGEEICYDLNKYNFSDKSPSIYLSVKQSKNDKAAVADVPEVVGSMFSGGLWMLFGGVGALFGVGGTLGTQALIKKKREKKEA